MNRVLIKLEATYLHSPSFNLFYLSFLFFSSFGFSTKINVISSLHFSISLLFSQNFCIFQPTPVHVECIDLLDEPFSLSITSKFRSVLLKVDLLDMHDFSCMFN